MASPPSAGELGRRRQARRGALVSRGFDPGPGAGHRRRISTAKLTTVLSASPVRGSRPVRARSPPPPTRVLRRGPLVRGAGGVTDGTWRPPRSPDGGNGDGLPPSPPRAAPILRWNHARAGPGEGARCCSERGARPYTADVTRTFPVGGRFGVLASGVYALLAAQGRIRAARPGARLPPTTARALGSTPPLCGA
jgi:hypothetical protein